LFINNLAGLPVDAARVLQELGLMTMPTGNSYIPAWWDPILQPMYRITAYTMQPAFYLAIIVLVGYSFVIFRRLRFGTSGDARGRSGD
jgi:hypothetical protein